MKTTILLLPLFVLFTSCDAPQRTRLPATGVTGEFYSTTGGTTNGTTGMSTGGTTGSTTGSSNSVTSVPGFETCSLGDKYHSIDLGYFGLCQSTQSETIFKFRTSLSSTSVRVCLIPTYKDNSGSSTYIGQPQCTYTTAGQVMSGTLYKDRSGFSNYPINGVMVMKETLLTSYFACMQGYTNWPANVCQSGSSVAYCNYWGPRCPYGASSNGACDTEARNYMGQICNTFKTQYTNSYVDIKLK